MIEVAAGERPTKVLMRFRLCCGETGAVVESQWWGQSNMPGDKAADGGGGTGAEVLPEGHVCHQHGRRGRRPRRACQRGQAASSASAPATSTTAATATDPAHRTRYHRVERRVHEGARPVPGMDWSMFGAQIMQTGDGGRETLARLPRPAAGVSRRQADQRRADAAGSHSPRPIRHARHERGKRK